MSHLDSMVENKTDLIFISRCTATALLRLKKPRIIETVKHEFGQLTDDKSIYAEFCSDFFFLSVSFR